MITLKPAVRRLAGVTVSLLVVGGIGLSQGPARDPGIRCRELLGISAPVEPSPQDYCERYRQLTGQDLLQCPQCQEGQMRRIGVLPAGAVTAGWNSS